MDPDLPADAIPNAQVRRFLTRSSSTRRRRSGCNSGRGRRDSCCSIHKHRPLDPRKGRKTRIRKAPELATAGIASALPAGVPNPQPFVPARPALRCLRGYQYRPEPDDQARHGPDSAKSCSRCRGSPCAGSRRRYLEVIDVDPASGCFYEPVNLDDPSLLAQNGLPPSEGTPQFHQQMVYAVASLTINNFERALGRRSLWRHGPPPPGEPQGRFGLRPRLRVYPHALREPNAYYSPDKMALLFGYFRASRDQAAQHVPGGMVFTCLSHDIIVHETTHALIDGLREKFTTSTNPDVSAFHEAFADIIALFQHFTFTEILRQRFRDPGLAARPREPARSAGWPVRTGARDARRAAGAIGPSTRKPAFGNRT